MGETRNRAESAEQLQRHRHGHVQSESRERCQQFSEHPIGSQHVSAEPAERHVEQVSDIKLLLGEVAPVPDDTRTLPDVEASPEHGREDAQRSVADHAIQHEQVEEEAGPGGEEELAALSGVGHPRVLLSKLARGQDIGLRGHLEHDRPVEPLDLVAQRQAGEERWAGESSGSIEKLERPADGPGEDRRERREN